MARTFRSRVTRAVQRSSSVRTTIPEAVAALLGAESGSELEWEVEPGSGSVVVRKAPDERPGKREMVCAAAQSGV